MSAFRLGTTSYILPDDILPNVRFLADQVDDVELVLFQVDEDGGNLPDRRQIAKLSRLAEESDLSYTVHLPLDLRMGASGAALDRSLRKARLVIERTLPLEPWAFVLHLDGKEANKHPSWADQAIQSLGLAGEWAGGSELLAVENLEGYPTDFCDEVLSQASVSRCVDIGHLWLDGHDPIPYLERALPKTRVIHIHGIGTRDHQSLEHVDLVQLREVVQLLVTSGYDGVVTLEVFGSEEFDGSMRALRQAGMQWSKS